MILKKPFAFLIKHFKIIHIILLLFITYIAYNFSKLVTFFDSYVKNSNVVNGRIITSSIPISILAIFIVIIFSGLMWYLMYRKEKPSKFYLLNGVYYIILLVFFIYANDTIEKLELATITQQTARALRDVYLILFFPNIYFIIMSFIRGIGFDIKRFNFGKDLEELEIKSEDNEEFEFVVGNDSYKTKRKFRRFIREFGYYLKENKFFISIIVGGLLIFGGVSFALNVSLFNHTYKVGETLKTENYTFKLNNAFITSYDYKGKQINSDKTFLVFSFNVKSNSNERLLKNEEINLKINKEYLNPEKHLSSSFSDLGSILSNAVITNQEKEYVLIYELNEKQIKKQYEINIFDKVKYSNNKAEDIYRKYKVKPINLDQNYQKEESKMNTSISLNNSVFGNTNLTIKSAKIASNYIYQNNQDVILPQNGNNKLAIIEYDLNIDSNSIVGNNIKQPSLFFNKFIKFGYSENGNDYEFSTSVQSIKGLDNMLFADVPTSVSNYANKYIIISTRTNHIKIPIQ